MTAFLMRAAVTALMTSALGACAMEAPQYPIREAAAPPPVPVRPIPAQAAAAPPIPAPAAYAPSRAPSIIAVNTMASAQPERRDAAATSELAQADTTQPAPATETPGLEHDQAPITEPPVGSGVLPQVNRRPGAAPENAEPPAAPAAVSRRASRSRTPSPPPAAHPQVAGRVESVDDLSHTVEVEKGDTVNTISDGLMTPKEALIKANRLKKPYELEIGRSLKIPVHKVYVVQSGDSLYGIARRFSTPVDVLSDINRLDAKSRLRPGQKIALPQLAKDTGPMARPGESAAELARADDNPAPQNPSLRREAPPMSSEPAAVESASAASSSSRADPYAAPTAPRPYASVSPRPPSRSSYPPSAAPTVEMGPPPSDSQIQIAGRGRFIWPVRGDLLSGFGPKPDGQRNDGVDIAAPEHSAVRAAASGDVVYAGDQIPGFGNLVLIKHEGGWVTAYAHLALSEVKIREHVSQGSEIGQVGETGGVAQPQLHFEIRYAPSPRDKARPIDPNLVLTRQSDD